MVAFVYNWRISFDSTRCSAACYLIDAVMGYIYIKKNRREWKKIQFQSIDSICIWFIDFLLLSSALLFDSASMSFILNNAYKIEWTAKQWQSRVYIVSVLSVLGLNASSNAKKKSHIAQRYTIYSQCLVLVFHRREEKTVLFERINFDSLVSFAFECVCVFFSLSSPFSSDRRNKPIFCVIILHLYANRFVFFHDILIEYMTWTR